MDKAEKQIHCHAERPDRRRELKILIPFVV